MMSFAYRKVEIVFYQKPAFANIPHSVPLKKFRKSVSI